MISEDSGLADYVMRSVVAIFDGSRFLGSGFFVQRGVLVTCAHVVEGRPDTVDVIWRRHQLAGRVVLRDPPVRDEADEVYPYPDLAFIKVDESLNHPYMYLTGARAGDALPGAGVPELYAIGFVRPPRSKDLVQQRLQLDVGGFSGDYDRLKNDQIPPGFSGSAVVESATGTVWGMVKLSHSYRESRGGLMLPAKIIMAGLTAAGDLLQLRKELEAPLLPPSADWLLDLLRAQRAAAENLPYRLVERGAPPLSSIYVHQRARPGAAAADNTKRPGIDAHEVLATARHGLIVAGPGAGKTTLLHHIMKRTADAWSRAHLGGSPPPFGRVVALRVPALALVSGRPWRDAIAEAVTDDLGSQLDHRFDARVLDRPPMPGCNWLIMVDGVDEILDAGRRHDLLTALSARLGDYDRQVRYLITSRPLYQREIRILRRNIGLHEIDRYGEYWLSQFGRDQLSSFVSAWFKARAPAAAAERSARFLRQAGERGLESLLLTPLLATIAAIVFENQSSPDLPTDRTGLYRQFVHYLLQERQERLDVVRQLTRQFRRRPDPAGLAEALRHQTEACLEYLAEVRLREDRRPTLEMAVAFYRARHPALSEVNALESLVGLVLASTGLVVEAAGGVDFTHQSFAEYLAAGRAVRDPGFSWKTWVRRAEAGPPTSLDLFVLARWIQDGNDPLPVLTSLVSGGRLRDESALLVALDAVIQDGMRLGADKGAAFFAYVLHWARTGSRPFPSPASVLRLFGRLLRSPRHRSAVRELAADPTVRVGARVAAASAMLRHEPGLASDALEQLWLLARHGPAQDRLVALNMLARETEPEQQGEAIEEIAMIAAAATSDDDLVAVVRLLTRLDAEGFAVVVLMGRGLDPDRRRAERLRSLEMIGSVLAVDPEAAGVWQQDSDLRWIDAEYTEFNIPGLLKSRDFYFSAHERLQHQLIYGARLLHAFDPAAGEWVMTAVARSTSLSGHDLVMLGLQRWDDPVWELLFEIMYDPRASVSDRVGAAEAVARRGWPDEARAALSDWLADRDADPDLRRRALDLLTCMRSGSGTRKLAEEVAADIGTDRRLRLHAALALAHPLRRRERAEQILRDWSGGNGAMGVRYRLMARAALVLLRVDDWIGRRLRSPRIEAWGSRLFDLLERPR